MPPDICLLEADSRWTGQQPLTTAVAAGSATGQAGCTGLVLPSSWQTDGSHAAVLESGRQQPPHHRQDALFHCYKSGGRVEGHSRLGRVDSECVSCSGRLQAEPFESLWPVRNCAASGWRRGGSEWVSAVCGGCNGGQGQGRVVHGSHSQSESQYSREDPLDPSSWCNHGGSGLALSAGGTQSRLHETWDWGTYAEHGAAAAYPSMTWGGEGGMGTAYDSGWHLCSNRERWGGNLDAVTGISCISDAATTPSRPCPDAGFHVCHGGYGSDGAWLPTLADGRALEGGAAVAWPGVGSA